MAKKLCIVLLLIGLLALTPGTLANTEILADGIITLDESGEIVAQIQTRLRELGYFHFKPTGNYQGMTKNSVIAFQTFQEDESGTPFIADGTMGPQSLAKIFSTSAVRAPIAADVHIPIGKSAGSAQTQTGAQTPWSEVLTLLIVGESYALTDFNTGETFSMIFTGGAQHAEMECATREDTEKLQAVFGGAFSFFKRPMLISVNDTLIACSLQGEPHGESTVEGNSMPGHACLFFYESRSHVGGLSDVEHRENVAAAAGIAQ